MSSSSTARSRTRPSPRRFAKAHPERYFEMYIAEQQMVAAAVGLQAVGWRPFASTFAAFLSRAYDFVRMAAVSRATFSLCGSHAGVSIGEDGPSQMALEDIATLSRDPREHRAPSVRREPDGAARRSDGRHGRDLVPAHAATGDAGPLRARRGVRDRRESRPSLVGRRRGRAHRCGITVHEALKAADLLAEEGIAARVIDLYSIKPLDSRDAARRRRGDSGAASSRSRITGRRAASAMPFSRRSRTRMNRRGSSSSRFARCRARASPRSCSPPRESTRSTSPLQRGASPAHVSLSTLRR